MSGQHPINGTKGAITQIQATSLLVSYWRYKESQKPEGERLIDDLPDELLLEVLLTPAQRDKFEQSPVLHRGIDTLALRTRFIDDWVLDRLPSFADDPVKKQNKNTRAKVVVNLGAGMDARPYRLQGLKQISKYIEIDSNNELLEVKHRILQTGGATTGDCTDSTSLGASEERAMQPYCSVVRLEADLTDLDQTRRMLRCGGIKEDNEETIDFIAEGLFAYVDPHLHQPLLRLCCDMSGKGSRMILTVLDPAGVDNFQSMNSFQIPWKRLVPVGELAKQAQQCGWKRTKIYPLNDIFDLYNRRKESDLKGYAILTLEK